MKLLQDLKNRLAEFKHGQLLITQKAKNPIQGTLITKAFLEDEDLFLFI